MNNLEKMIMAVKACLGTPFHHQGRKKDVGLDCIGLVIIGLKAIDIKIKDRLDYGVRPDGVSLINAIKEHGGREVKNIQAGDILVFRYDNQPQHVAIALSDSELIHSFAPARKVVQTSIGDYWKRRLVAIFRFNEIIGD